MKNLGQLMKQAQEMQAKMQEMQERVAEAEATGLAGGGMVSITLNGKNEMRSVKIDPSLADPDDMEILEDLIVAAYNDRQGQDRGPCAGGDAEGHRRPQSAAGNETALLGIVRARATPARLRAS